MSLPWFRMYSEAVDDEKLRLLAFEDRWHFVALLCCKAKGILDEQTDAEILRRKVAVKLGLDLRTLEEVARRLDEVDLINQDTFQPLAWDLRQFVSDADPTRNERQKRYREKKRVTNALRNGRVTRVDSDTDTDTERKQPSAADATPPASQEGSKQSKAITFATFVARRKSANEKLIAEDDPIFGWAESAGIPEDWLRLAWMEFSARYKGNAKRYVDWPATFRNAVRNNWFKFWRISEHGLALTTEGEMARRAAEDAARKDRQEAA